MRVVDLADKYHLTTADAIDLCVAAGIAADGSDYELNDAEVDRWSALAEEQKAWHERDAREARASVAVGAENQRSSQPASADGGSPTSENDPAADDGAGFGPIPPAPWEPTGAGRSDLPAGAPQLLASGPDLTEWGARAPGADAPQITPFAPAALALAVVSFIFPFITALGAYALAHIAKVRIRESKGRVTGERMAVAAQVISVVGMAFWLVLLGMALYSDYQVAQNRTRVNDLQVDTQIIQWNELKPGQCVRIPHADIAVRDWQGVSCDAPHEAEVTSVVTINRRQGDAYPGRGSFIPLATERCAADFEKYVGIPYSTSGMKVGAAFPSPGNWRAENDRTLVCFVYQNNYDYINGSAKDAKR